MRVDRWRDNIHGRGASRLSLKASREISQFLQANETDGDTQRVFSLSLSLSLFRLNTPGSYSGSSFQLPVAFSISRVVRFFQLPPLLFFLSCHQEPVSPRGITVGMESPLCPLR